MILDHFMHAGFLILFWGLFWDPSRFQGEFMLCRPQHLKLDNLIGTCMEVMTQVGQPAQWMVYHRWGPWGKGFGGREGLKFPSRDSSIEGVASPEHWSRLYGEPVPRAYLLGACRLGGVDRGLLYRPVVSSSFPFPRQIIKDEYSSHFQLFVHKFWCQWKEGKPWHSSRWSLKLKLDSEKWWL